MKIIFAQNCNCQVNKKLSDNRSLPIYYTNQQKAIDYWIDCKKISFRDSNKVHYAIHLDNRHILNILHGF